MLTLDLLLLSPPWTIKFQGALTLSTFLAFAYCKFFLQKYLLSRDFAGSIVARGGTGPSTSSEVISFFTYEM